MSSTYSQLEEISKQSQTFWGEGGGVGGGEVGEGKWLTDWLTLSLPAMAMSMISETGGFS